MGKIFWTTQFNPLYNYIETESTQMFDVWAYLNTLVAKCIFKKNTHIVFNKRSYFYSYLCSCHEHKDDPNFCNTDNFNNHFI